MVRLDFAARCLVGHPAILNRFVFWDRRHFRPGSALCRRGALGRLLAFEPCPGLPLELFAPFVTLADLILDSLSGGELLLPALID